MLYRLSQVISSFEGLKANTSPQEGFEAMRGAEFLEDSSAWRWSEFRYDAGEIDRPSLRAMRSPAMFGRSRATSACLS